MNGEVIDRGDVVEWRERLGRAGFVARGVVYGIVAVIAIAVALGGEKSTADQSGALASLADSPAGQALLVALAIGLAAMALFRLVEAFTGATVPHSGETEEKLERVASAIRAVIYGGLCYTAVAILADSGSGGGSESQATSTVFDLPAGVALVLIAGVVIVGVALYQGYRALSTSFEDELETARMGPRLCTLARVLGVTGHAARAVVFALVGIFLIRAAVDHDANEAIGIDGALQEIAQQAYGTVLLTLTAVGLLLFGLYSLIEAGYRRF